MLNEQHKKLFKFFPHCSNSFISQWLLHSSRKLKIFHRLILFLKLARRQKKLSNFSRWCGNFSSSAEVERQVSGALFAEKKKKYNGKGEIQTQTIKIETFVRKTVEKYFIMALNIGFVCEWLSSVVTFTRCRKDRKSILCCFATNFVSFFYVAKIDLFCIIHQA